MRHPRPSHRQFDLFRAQGPTDADGNDRADEAKPLPPGEARPTEMLAVVAVTEGRDGRAFIYLDRLTAPSNSIVWRPQRRPRTEASLGGVTITRRT